MKYRFEITYQNKYVKQASDFLRKCDLGIDAFGIKEIISFTSQKDIKISEIKEKIDQAYESCDCKILHIEGGKIE